VNPRFAGRAAVGRALRAAVCAAIGTAVVNSRLTGCAAVGRPLGTAVCAAIGTAVVNPRPSRSTAVGRPFSAGLIVFKHRVTPISRVIVIEKVYFF
jgi:hypothetical protein